MAENMEHWKVVLWSICMNGAMERWNRKDRANEEAALAVPMHNDKLNGFELFPRRKYNIANENKRLK